MTGSSPDLSALLEAHRDSLLRFMAREASGLLRHESEDDLVQGAHMHALKVAGHFEYQGDEAFLGWLFKIARQHIADRHAYWSALKRNAGKLLRISAGIDGSSTEASGFDPPASMTGPLTFAGRREQITIAISALDTLQPRDQQLIEWAAAGMHLEDIADRLELSREATQKARARAFARFKAAYEALETY